MFETHVSPIAVKVFRIADDGSLTQIGGYLDDVAGRAALVKHLDQVLDTVPVGKALTLAAADVRAVGNGLASEITIGSDRYVIDNPQARVDRSERRTCPECGEPVDDTRFLDQPCSRRIGQDIDPDEPTAFSGRLPAGEGVPHMVPARGHRL